MTHLSRLRRMATLATPLLLLPFLTSCLNLFSPLDHPSGDPQLMSAARAALDRGDFATALQDYQKVASATDYANSEQAYTILNQNGAGFGVFASAFGTGTGVDPGKAITNLANSLAPNAGATARSAMLQAYQLSLQISATANGPLRGLVQFLAGTALLAEMLAEISTTPGHLVPSDIVTNPTTCLANGTGIGCLTAPGCAIGNVALTNGTAATPVQPETATSVTGTITLSLIQTAMDGINHGLNLIGSNGGLGSSVSSFTTATGVGDDAIKNGTFTCYRYTLLTLNIGAY